MGLCIAGSAEATHAPLLFDKPFSDPAFSIYASSHSSVQCIRRTVDKQQRAGSLGSRVRLQTCLLLHSTVHRPDLPPHIDVSTVLINLSSSGSTVSVNNASGGHDDVLTSVMGGRRCRRHRPLLVAATKSIEIFLSSSSQCLRRLPSLECIIRPVWWTNSRCSVFDASTTKPLLRQLLSNRLPTTRTSPFQGY